MYLSSSAYSGLSQDGGYPMYGVNERLILHSSSVRLLYEIPQAGLTYVYVRRL